MIIKCFTWKGKNNEVQVNKHSFVVFKSMQSIWSKMFPGCFKCFKDVSRVLIGCFKQVSRLFQGSFKRVSMQFQVCFMGVARLFQRFFKEIWCFWGCLKVVLLFFLFLTIWGYKLFHGSFKGTLDKFKECMFQECFKEVCGAFQLSLKGVKCKFKVLMLFL